MAFYSLAADAVLTLHFAVVLFVIGGLVAVVAGYFRHWVWVRGMWFRLAHLAAIGVVVAQSWLGMLCPLTVLESWLRREAGQSPYERGFIEYWIHRVLYWEAPWWVFTTAYTAFGALVIAAWWCCPPQWPKRNGRGD